LGSIPVKRYNKYTVYYANGFLLNCFSCLADFDQGTISLAAPADDSARAAAAWHLQGQKRGTVCELKMVVDHAGS